MPQTVLEKLLIIADEIKEGGSVPLTRLTVLKKWFEQNPRRLSSFTILVANRASMRKGGTSGEAAKLFREARALLKVAELFDPQISIDSARKLHGRLHAFQDEYKRLQWGPVRIIRNHDLFLVEEGLRIYQLQTNSPSDGYRLAARVCEHYDPKYGNGLNGPSYLRIKEIASFMVKIEVSEGAINSTP
jgi:hypothetical protein